MPWLLSSITMAVIIAAPIKLFGGQRVAALWNRFIVWLLEAPPEIAPYEGTIIDLATRRITPEATHWLPLAQTPNQRADLWVAGGSAPSAQRIWERPAGIAAIVTPPASCAWCDAEEGHTAPQGTSHITCQRHLTTVLAQWRAARRRTPGGDGAA